MSIKSAQAGHPNTKLVKEASGVGFSLSILLLFTFLIIAAVTSAVGVQGKPKIAIDSKVDLFVTVSGFVAYVVLSAILKVQTKTGAIKTTLAALAVVSGIVMLNELHFVGFGGPGAVFVIYGAALLYYCLSISRVK